MNPRGSFLLVLVAACASPGQAPSQDARSLIDDGRIAQGEAAARAQLARAVSAHGEHSIEAAEALALLGETLRLGYRGDQPETLAVCERALALERELLRPGDVRLARVLQDLALVRFVRQERGATQAARKLIEEALTIRQAATPVDARELALAYMAHAQLVFDDTEDLERASVILAEAARLQETGLPPVHRDVASRLACAGNLQYLAGEFERSRESYEQALAIQRQVLRPGHPVFASTLYSYSLTLESLGEYSHARALCEEALDQLTLALGPEHPYLVQISFGLAHLQSSMGEPLAAQACLERALAIQQHDTGETSFGALKVELQLADVCLDSGALQRAQELLERCEPSIDALPDLKPWWQPYLLQMHGRLKQAHGDLEGAAADFAAAVEAGDREYGSTSPALAPLLQTRGEIALRLGNWMLARDSYERAAALVQEHEGAASPNRAAALLGLARARAGLGECAGALDDALQADALSREHLEQTAGGFEEHALLDYAASRTHGLDLALALAANSDQPGAAARVFDALVRSRALLLDIEIGRLRFQHEQSDPGLAALSTELARASRRLANLLVRGPENDDAAGHAARVAEARRSQAEGERKLRAASPEYRRDRARSAAGSAQISDALPPGSVLLSYVRTSEDAPGWFAFVLRAEDRTPELIALGPATDVDPLIAQAVDDARSRAGESDFRRSAERLRERVWDPLAARLAGAERVFLVADAGLSFVDFDALPVADSQYLIETAPLLHELTAERDLLASADPEPSGSGLLAIGGPEFDRVGRDGTAPGPPRATSLDRSSLQDTSFGPLPKSAEEVRSIGELWSRLTPRTRGSVQVELLTGSAATEGAFKRLAPHHAVLHIATHGFCLAEGARAPIEGGRSPGRPVEPSARSAPMPLPAYRSEHPLELSGLALAGANLRERAGPDDEDGLLTAEEISCLDLSGTSWAVLSACETGLGVSHSDEGVLGLRRAFQVAGTRTVISSLWRVGDDLARDWMVELYRARLERKLGTAEAMRAVGLEMLRRRRAAHESTEPASWAGFVAVGDWR